MTYLLSNYIIICKIHFVIFWSRMCVTPSYHTILPSAVSAVSPPVALLGVCQCVGVGGSWLRLGACLSVGCSEWRPALTTDKAYVLCHENGVLFQPGKS